MRSVFAQRLPAFSALRRLSSASGSDAGGGGILERASAAVGLGEASRTRAAAKMAEARERGVSWTEATSEAMRDVRKERRSESLREFYEGLAAAPTFDLGALRAQYEEGLAAEDKMTATQRMGLRFDQLRGGEQAQALDEMKAELRTSLAILDAMTPAEALPISPPYGHPRRLPQRPDPQRSSRRLRAETPRGRREGGREGHRERERERERERVTDWTTPRAPTLETRRHQESGETLFRSTVARTPCPAPAPASQARNPLVLVKASRAAKERIVEQVGLSSDAPVKSVLMQFECRD